MGIPHSFKIKEKESSQNFVMSKIKCSYASIGTFLFPRLCWNIISKCFITFRAFL